MPNPSLRRWSLASFAGAAIWLVLSPLPACSTNQPAPMEPFKHHRLDSLARSLDAARTAQEQCRDGISQALDATDIDALATQPSRAALDDAYDRARHDLATCQTRVRVASERLRQANRRGNDIFDEWDKEIGYYSDEALQAQARRGYRDARQRYSDAIDKLDVACDTNNALLVELSDRMLFVKHHRDQPEIVEPKRTPEVIARMLKARQAIDAATSAASQAVAQFIDAMGQTN